jgi:glycosyltransferase involved in cell wall biosynthesis
LGLRILWSSNAAWTGTGYGVQTKLITPRLQALGHQVAITAFYGLEGAQLNLGDIPTYPRAYHPYGQDVVGAHSADWRADITISHMDLWVTEPQMFGSKVRHVPYFPIDMEPLPEIVRKKAELAYERIVFSRFGCRMMDDVGLSPMDMAEARAKLGFPADAFIVGMVAANKGTPSRKAIWQQVAAFAEFRKQHSDAVLYLHMTSGQNGEMGGVNVPEFIQRTTDLRIGTDVLFADQYRLIAGFNDAYMRAAYSSMDVMTLVSHGEGFGIPLIEAQACGTPVITGAWTAMDELCFAGWKVAKEDTQPVWTPLAAWQHEARIPAITEQMEQAYNARGVKKLREK